MSQMSGISAVIITLNEERNLGRCLESVKGLVDEIIVLDSFSTDKTESIARDYGARFVQRKWEGYSKTKNFANSLVSQDYILSLDADEALSDTLRESVLQAKSKGLSGIYSFNRLTNYCGKWVRHCGWYPDVKKRLFPKAAGKWEGDFVHETIVFESGHDHHHLIGDLLHYSFYSKAEHLERVEKYTDLGAQKLLAKNKKGGLIKGFFSAFSRFIRMYFIKQGFLDGATGFRICWISAKANVMKYRKLQKLRKHGG